MNLDHLLQRPDLWRGGRMPPAADSLPTGYPELDGLLPGGGWPRGALTEILTSREGVGALGLVMPALARLSRDRRWLAWVSPPYIPYVPALASAGVDLSRVLLVHPRAGSDGLWAVEQTLRSGTCGAVLAWPAAGDSRTLRRLQLAAEAGRTWGGLFRSERMAQRPSPAALRLQVTPERDGMAVRILKRRGGWAAGPVYLDADHVVAQCESALVAPGGVRPGRA